MQCEGFSAVMQRRMTEEPPTDETPWDIFVYSDEVMSGDPLSYHNKRKVRDLYFSLL